MLDEKGYGAPAGRSERCWVERTALLAEIDAELARTGVAVLCAPWGYGKSFLLRDYARMVRARSSGRPVVRVDFETFEAQTFMMGNHAPLLSVLRRFAKRHGKGGEEPRAKLRKLPARHSSSATHYIYEMLAAYAPAWRTAYEKGLYLERGSFDDLPLVTIDNLPRLDEVAWGKLADALTTWSAAGVRTILACEPSVFPRSFFMGASVVTAAALSVSPGEMALWSRELRLFDERAALEASRGVPLLVAACKSAATSDLSFDESFLRACEKVFERCLDEPMCASAERARLAMAMLRTGSLGDLALVGAPLRGDELAILAETFPLFGIDLARGSFSCIPVDCGVTSGVMSRIVGVDGVLTHRCVELLACRGLLRRAGDLAALMPDAARLRVFGCCPDVFADAANMGSIERAFKSPAATEAEEVSKAGLASLVRMYAFARDIPERALPEYVQRRACEPSGGALRAVEAVQAFWRRYGAADDGHPGVGDAVLPQPGELLACGVPKAADASCALDADEGRRGVDELVWLMGSAGLRGDGASFLRHLDELKGLVAFGRGGLAAAVYAFHAALCGFACDKAEEVLAWVAPLLTAARDASAPEGSVCTVSCALLNAACAMARYLVERPSANRVAGESLDALRASRRFFEERGVEPGIAAVSFLEALCLVGGAGERQALGLAAACQSRWSVQGNLMGQMATDLLMCVVNLTQDAVNQALVYARAGEAIAQKLGLRRLVWLARLFESIATIRGENRPDIDRRLLEATLRQSSLHPTVSVALSLEVALLQAARGDAPSARDVLHGVGLFARPSACRLLLVAVRTMRRHRACVLELLPRRLRSEYEALRPFPTIRSHTGGGGPLPAPGLLALPGPGVGLSIGLFGGLRVEINGHVVGEHVWERRTARRLAVVLALFPEKSLSRENLVEALWGDRIPTATVRNNLNTALSSLRASLGQKGGGPEYVVTAGNVVGFNPELVDVDVMRFERLARTVLARRGAAEAGEVLDACGALEQLFHTGFPEEFNEERGRVRQRIDELVALFVDCMVVGCDLALVEDDPPLAVWFARAARRAAPERKDLEIMLEESLDAMGRQEVGLRRGHELEEPRVEEAQVEGEVHAGRVEVENLEVCCG